ncbi:hypothetical protein ACFYXH_05990 [Streptomyces sp. NPDC002730]|uniref:hypothetical protein n=1 Tax=Streptomyces sp. NPDC002730 TaxID=3364662 RepID=UPI00368F9859
MVDVGASVFASSNQDIPTNTITKINFDGAAYDTDAMFDDASDSLVVNTPGRYLLKARLAWIYTATPGGTRNLRIRVNGVLVAFDGQDTTVNSGADAVSQEVSTIVELNTNDVIDLAAAQNTGSNAVSVPQSQGGDSPIVAPQLQAELEEP